MLRRRLWWHGVALMALLFLASCGGQETNDIAELRTAVDSLEQEIESLRLDVANLALRTGGNEQSAGDISSQLMTLSEALDSIA